VTLRDRLRFGPFHQKIAARLMEYALVGLLFIGLERRGTGIVVNSLVGLLIVQIPPLLERDYDIQMDPVVTLWITTAVFLHALGTVGIPGSGLGFYKTLWWYDHLTHALSASVVAAVGYATVRAIDVHSETVDLPPKFLFVFVLSFTMAFGVLWEVLEFAIGGLGILTQYGLEDTMLDLAFDVVGAVLVATWGTAYLTDLVGTVGDRLRARGAD
jgi:hypothetical protein